MWNETLITFLIELANFVILAMVLAWLFFNPVRKVLQEQREKIKSQERAAADALSEAEALRREIMSERKGLAAELEQLRNKTLEQAKIEASAVVDDARKNMELQRQALKRESVGIQRAQAVKIAQAVAAAAEQAVARLLHQLAGPELQQLLMNAACSELSGFANNSLETVTVESASELSAHERTQIEAVLGPAKKRAVYRIVPDLGGGLRISTAAGLIDTSVSGIARFAEEALFAELEKAVRDEANGSSN